MCIILHLLSQTERGSVSEVKRSMKLGEILSYVSYSLKKRRQLRSIYGVKNGDLQL